MEFFLLEFCWLTMNSILQQTQIRGKTLERHRNHNQQKNDLQKIKKNTHKTTTSNKKNFKKHYLSLKRTETLKKKLKTKQTLKKNKRKTTKKQQQNNKKQQKNNNKMEQTTGVFFVSLLDHPRCGGLGMWRWKSCRRPWRTGVGSPGVA